MKLRFKQASLSVGNVFFEITMRVQLSKLGMKEPNSWALVTEIWAKLSANDCKFVCDEVPEWLLPETEGLNWGTGWKRK